MPVQRERTFREADLVLVLVDACRKLFLKSRDRDTKCLGLPRDC